MALSKAARLHGLAAQCRSTMDLFPWTEKDDYATLKIITSDLSHLLRQCVDEDEEESRVSSAHHGFGNVGYYGCGKHLQCRRTAASTFKSDNKWHKHVVTAHYSVHRQFEVI
jgi:hypothetical protein